MCVVLSPELKCPSPVTLTFPRITEPFPPLFHAIKECYIACEFSYQPTSTGLWHPAVGHDSHVSEVKVKLLN
jgi:hypothetical protein